MCYLEAHKALTFIVEKDGMKFRFILFVVCFFHQFLFATEIKVLTLNTWMLRVNVTQRLSSMGLNGGVLTSILGTNTNQRSPLTDFANQFLNSILGGESLQVENNQHSPSINLNLAKDCDQRIKIILNEVSKINPDLILLQEVWDLDIRKKFIDEFKSIGYPHSVFSQKKSLLLGDGLLIVSRYELRSTDSMTFSMQTTWDERLTEKGAIFTQMKVPTERDQDVFLNVLNVHAGSVPFDSARRMFDQQYQGIKLRQLEEVAAWMKNKINSGKYGPLWIVGGDLNSHYVKRYFSAMDEKWNYYKNGIDLPHPTPEYKLFTSNEPGCLGLLDAYSAANPTASASERCTFDTDGNTYTSSGHHKDLPSETVDYIFVTGTYLKVLEARRALDQPVENDPHQRIFASDHYGILVNLEIL